MEDITPVKEIDSIKDDFTIKVHTIRLWTQKSKFDANDTYSIETILMDEEGRKIHASCVKKWFPKFQRYLKEDTSLYIRKPNVAPNTSNFNFADPERKLTLNPDTTLKECENFSGSAHDFAFVDFNTILSNNILESNSIDIIGHIFEYGRMDTSEQDKSKHKMLMHLQEIKDTKLKVTLWGHNAYYMHDFLTNNNSLAPVVVIVQFAKVKFINGHPFISTYFDEKTVVIVGTVKGIRQNIRWYYLACSNCKKSAKQKESSTNKLGINLDLYPMELKVVVDKKLAIKIDISSYNITKSWQLRLISQGDNLTPCARDNSTATSPTKLISTPTELKRNLATCIDLDEMENLSTSKSARLSPPDEQPMPLLVPKKEK
ncbi:unnamed protein product [Lactuca virosa]|uniref:Replication protein A 70 kDa DNA-binding subunit B/D first OB fold domain-containing protein n=1 Tax=Lactuca virosa TaxID=75947 RepID=A0AAU9NV05_9ASTR|nr:unnamed protein product [Lactuca virosa]